MFLVTAICSGIELPGLSQICPKSGSLIGVPGVGPKSPKGRQRQGDEDIGVLMIIASAPETALTATRGACAVYSSIILSIRSLFFSPNRRLQLGKLRKEFRKICQQLEPISPLTRPTIARTPMTHFPLSHFQELLYLLKFVLQLPLRLSEFTRFDLGPLEFLEYLAFSSANSNDPRSELNTSFAAFLRLNENIVIQNWGLPPGFFEPECTSVEWRWWGEEDAGSRDSARGRAPRRGWLAPQSKLGRPIRLNQIISTCFLPERLSSSSPISRSWL